ncbi:hypothetical protein POSPLADRAFT_1134364 [Postia placenta MAD-698-R-SB12]|uniref:RING-type E3 ubiquitin transferase n=1 Tax=Postia placenta MAD-698-R-SB12 TaxID=670580 RepID=A0A1X6NA58_9APHY|nr:hypothetical protein POSPLADRAFT_1134364 [Postia placenta MAD-698-R-SB12]OSX65392.1 hypothetical protein POSPLADRAFT_1134364 [Postia placenta MAD-698-R-SB12]
MSTTTNTQTRATGQRGRRGKGRGGSRGSQRGKTTSSTAPETPQPDSLPASNSMQSAAKDDPATEETDDDAVCWICAEPVKYYSLSECNHRTCHVCALRLRALYKKQECTFCKEPQPSVLFTKSADTPWSLYTPDMIPYKDPKLSISFETQEMMEETLILLRFNCPDAECDYIGNGWSDLKLHTRAVHGKLMCDLCIRFKKIFSHEHALYPPNVLPIHLPSMHRSHGRGAESKQQVEGGIHPLCEFCRECFFSDDELYAHMREKHEECFVCKRHEVKDQYFRNYDALEQHFMHGHFPCIQPQCLARKFVVFGSALDLKAHMVEEHGAEMSARDKKDAMRIQAEFEFEEVGGAGRRGRRDRQGREREREPPPLPVISALARGSGAGGRRREAFSGNLTLDNPSTSRTPNGNTLSRSQQPSRRQSPSPPEAEAGTAERSPALVARINSLAPNPTSAVPAIQAAIRSYRASESGARDLISTVWNILDRNLDGSASIVNLLVDGMDEEEKRRDLLAAWNGFKVEQRGQFPELVPTSTGTQWAGVTSGRVLNAKHSTASRSSAQSSRQLWDRVAQAAGSSSSTSSIPPARPPERFPPLQPPTTNPAFRQSQRNTPWASSAAAATPVPMRGPTSVPGPGATSRSTPTLSKSAFPELPSLTVSRVPKSAVSGNQSLKKILGESVPAVPAWAGKNGADPSTSSAAGESSAEGGNAQESTTGKGKKGKGKQKQTLFTLGSFPT